MKKFLKLVVIVPLLLVGCKDKGSNEVEVIESEDDSIENETLVIEMDVGYEALAESIDYYLTDQNFNGAALVSTGDKIIFTKGYGLANLEQEIPVETNTKFQIASVSKSFVAVSVLQLMEDGLIELDQTIDKYFPTMPNANRITIHHLLTHTSGLYSSNDYGYGGRYSTENTVDDLLEDAYRENNLYFEEPGVSAIYSNLGYDVLGAIIEQVSGMTYEEYVRVNIFKPTGMKDTLLNVDGLVFENFAVAYNGNIEEGYRARIFHPSYGYASGGVHSTVEDLYRYDRALANNELISEESYELMTQQYTRVGNKPYGYGWYTNLWIEDTISHPGNLVGWHSMMLRHNEDKVTVILLTNHDESDMNMAYTIARLVLANVE
ncbi:MAG TPA: serine hydrolase [Firmicutes bacterium]|nr:serine hydrolase [Bacillota bacterium]